MDITAGTDGVTIKLHGVALTDIAEVMSAESGAEHVTRLAAMLLEYADFKRAERLN